MVESDYRTGERDFGHRIDGNHELYIAGSVRVLEREDDCQSLFPKLANREDYS